MDSAHAEINYASFLLVAAVVYVCIVFEPYLAIGILAILPD